VASCPDAFDHLFDTFCIAKEKYGIIDTTLPDAPCR
jgi:hypothetical protein